MPALAREHRVVAMDLRGYNLSDQPPGPQNYAMPHLLADVRAVIEHQGSATGATVIGHDWGGAIAWQLAMTHPEHVTRLVVLNMPHPAAFILWADPVDLMLVIYGRTSQWGPIARGRLLAWGRKPWLGLSFQSRFFNP